MEADNEADRNLAGRSRLTPKTTEEVKEVGVRGQVQFWVIKAMKVTFIHN